MKIPRDLQKCECGYVGSWIEFEFVESKQKYLCKKCRSKLK